MNLGNVRALTGGIFLMALLVVSAQATSITVESGAANGTTLDAAGAIPAIDITPNAAWDPAAPQWVSDTANTGDTSDPGFVVRPNGAVSFYHSFLLPIGEPLLVSANLMVWADDTSSVELNGTEIFSASAGPFPTCSLNPIGCLETTKGVFGLADLEPLLNLEGANQLVFNVEQANLVSFGLAYTGSFETSQRITPADTPEPASVILVGAGILLLGVVRKQLQAKR